MGLVRTDQLRNRAGTGNADLFKQWAAKALADFNGTGTAEIRDSRNISSLIDNGTGSYNLNYTNTFVSSNYSNQYTIGRGATGSTALIGISPRAAGAKETYTIGMLVVNSSFAAVDCEFNSIISTGDLA